MVGNRPVVGVRNPVCSTSTSNYLRAKNAGTGSPASGGTPHPGNENRRVNPVRLLEAALHPQNKKE
jgi:hypothetical protein